MIYYVRGWVGSDSTYCNGRIAVPDYETTHTVARIHALCSAPYIDLLFPALHIIHLLHSRFIPQHPASNPASALIPRVRGPLSNLSVNITQRPRYL